MKFVPGPSLPKILDPALEGIARIRGVRPDERSLSERIW